MTLRRGKQERNNGGEGGDGGEGEGREGRRGEERRGKEGPGRKGGWAITYENQSAGVLILNLPVRGSQRASI